MKGEREIIDYLNDILGAIEKIEQFTKGFNYSKFVKDEKTVFAVIRALEIIGEATRSIPESTKKKYSAVPWREIAGIRNKLIHEYFGVNYEVIWKTIKEDLKPLKESVKKIIEKV